MTERQAEKIVRMLLLCSRDIWNAYQLLEEFVLEFPKFKKLAIELFRRKYEYEYVDVDYWISKLTKLEKRQSF